MAMRICTHYASLYMNVYVCYLTVNMAGSIIYMTRDMQLNFRDVSPIDFCDESVTDVAPFNMTSTITIINAIENKHNVIDRRNRAIATEPYSRSNDSMTLNHRQYTVRLSSSERRSCNGRVDMLRYDISGHRESVIVS